MENTGAAMNVARISVSLNERTVWFEDERSIIDILHEDDDALVKYVNDAVKNGEITFLGEEDLKFLHIARNSFYTPVPVTQQQPQDNEESFNGNDEGNDETEKTANHGNSEVEETVHLNANDVLVEVWCSKGKPSHNDEEATLAMLNLRAEENMIKRFNDKKSVKLNLWREIADKLFHIGFKVDAEKCRQKFTNLVKHYTDFKRHVNQTGTERKDPPKYYDILDIIMGKKDKITLKNVQDTLDKPKGNEVPDECNGINSELSSPNNSKSKVTKEQFGKPGNSRGPKEKQAITKQDILMEIKKQGENQERHMDKFCSLIEEQNKQRAEIIQIFKAMAQETSTSKTKPKKRKRSSSESE